MSWLALFSFTLALVAPAVQYPVAKPVAQVERHTVVYPGRPLVSVTVPSTATYLGADRFVLKELSDCEMHIFVEADANRRVKRFYWVHFESNLPSRPNDRMHYADTDQHLKRWGVTLWTSAEPAQMSRTPRPDSDTAHFRSIIRNAGYTMPPGMMTARLVRLLDDPKDTGFGRREVMMLYGEDLASTGLTYEAVTNNNEKNDRWTALEGPLLERALDAFHLTEHR